MKGHNSLYPKSPIALTILGCAGVIATAVTAVKATPKALKIIEKEFEDVPPTKKEVVEATWKCYIPSAIIGIATIGCIIGSTGISYKSQASLISAYTLLERSYKEYKDKVKELFGEDGEREVKASIVRDHFMEGDHMPTPLGEKLIFYIDHYEDFFERTMLEVKDAEYELNRKFTREGLATLNDFFRLLDLPETEIGELIGWSIDGAYEESGYFWIEFEHTLITMDEVECYAIDTPYRPDFLYAQN